MDTSLLKEALLEELQYADSPDLRQASELWPNDRPIPYIENAYFIQGVPIVYFSRIEDPEKNVDDIWRLYRSVWSQGKVPLLYIITPQEIRIYNGYAEPTKTSKEFVLDTDEKRSDRLLKHLQQLTSIETARQQITQQLQGYDRLSLETGVFWKTDDGQKIQQKSRADQRLLSAMDQVRRRLLETLPQGKEAERSEEIAYALLGRSLFIRYLEDRGILSTEWVFQITDGFAHNFFSALEDKNITYRLFDYLSQRFNGNLFPVEKEERLWITHSHLYAIQQFLSGNDLAVGQLALWPYYDFTHIPIELISGIYDTFLSDKKRKKLGAYFTPLALADFMIEETLPREKTHSNTTILDPACGSGVFLVRAYQRLVEAWKRENSNKLSGEILSKLLTENIFGIDIQLNAVRIAAFSLYLTMLDYLENEDIIDERFHFPGLENTNLICKNFLSNHEVHFFKREAFDRIVGNLPWGKSGLDDETLELAEELEYASGGKQLVQPFLLHAARFCAQDGEIALLVSAKATIFVTSRTHEEFRDHFFQRYQVRAVVNFSALRHELFPDAKSPMVGLFYQPSLSEPHKKLTYAIPKPSALSQRLGAIVLSANEIIFFNREDFVAYPDLWKVAMWGKPRDASIIQHLRTFPTLLEQAKKYGWLVEVKKGKGDIPQGYIVGNKETEALWLQGLPYVGTTHFKAYSDEIHGIVEEDHFERPRQLQIYNGPLVLIGRSTCKAAFFGDERVAYRDKITGIPGKRGQEHLLKWLVAYINSSLARYYHFLTSTSWAVERDTIIHEEYKRMPFLIPSEDGALLSEVAQLVDQIAARVRHDREMFEYITSSAYERIDEIMFDIYRISRLERQVIKDMLEYTIPHFRWTVGRQRIYTGKKAMPVKVPDSQMLIKYATTFIETTLNLLKYQNQTLNAYIYQNSAPLIVLEFELVSQENAQDAQRITAPGELQFLLSKLDKLLTEKRYADYYTRRFIRIVDGPRLYFVRPSEAYLWTQSQALADADGFLSEMLRHSKRSSMEAHR